MQIDLQILHETCTDCEEYCKLDVHKLNTGLQ